MADDTRAAEPSSDEQDNDAAEPLSAGTLQSHVPAKRKLTIGNAPLTLVVGSVLVGAVVVLALVSFVWTPFDPDLVNVEDRLLPPFTDGYLFGTDRLGRDVLTQIMAGARNSLFVSFVATVGSLIPGVLLGLMAAGSGERWYTFWTRVADIGIALPGILIALVLAVIIGPGNTAAIVAILTWFTPIVIRITVGPAKQILARDFIEAAYAYGRTRRYILLRHILPNISPLLIVQTSVMFAAAILIEASLAFLGVGAQRPTPSWGRLLNEAQPLLDIAPTLMVFPGLAIVIAVLGFNLLGDGLRATLDPQQASKAGGTF
ncbi:MAG: ABC transporter permease [Nitriliruptoraceae bacterium]